MFSPHLHHLWVPLWLCYMRMGCHVRDASGMEEPHGRVQTQTNMIYNMIYATFNSLRPCICNVRRAVKHEIAKLCTTALPHGVYYLRLLWTVLPTSPPTGTTTTVSYADGMPRARCQWNGRIRWACTIYLTKTPNPSTMSWWTMGPYVMLRKVHNNIPCLFYV